MEWSNKYKLGHEVIDLEHRLFFYIMNSVEQAEAEGASRNRMRSLITEIVKYSEFHFLSEENIMIASGYPDFQVHREIHQELMRELKKHVVQFEAGKSKPYELVNFLYSWFSQHTLADDSVITNHINTRASSSKKSSAMLSG